MSTVVQPEQILQSWLQQLSSLIDDVEAGASELGWSARRVDIELSDAEVGKYQAPSLFLEQGACEIWVYPRYRDTPNDEGVVDVEAVLGPEAQNEKSNDGGCKRCRHDQQGGRQKRITRKPIRPLAARFRASHHSSSNHDSVISLFSPWSHLMRPPRLRSTKGWVVGS